MELVNELKDDFSKSRPKRSETTSLNLVWQVATEKKIYQQSNNLS